MPRKTLRATAKEVQRSRRDWYIFHFENRERAKQLQYDQLQAYLTATSYVEPPAMTIFGGLPESYPERKAYEIASHSRLDVNLINPWYLTEQGWSDFQKLWSELPEPVDLFINSPCVQVGELYTLSTMPAEAEAHKR